MIFCPSSSSFVEVVSYTAWLIRSQFPCFLLKGKMLWPSGLVVLSVMVHKCPCLSTWAKTGGRAANVWACLPSHSVHHGSLSVQWHVAFILTIRPTVRSGDVSGLQSDRLGRDSGHTVCTRGPLPQELALTCGHELGSSVDSHRKGIYLLLNL